MTSLLVVALLAAEPDTRARETAAFGMATAVLAAGLAVLSAAAFSFDAFLGLE